MDSVLADELARHRAEPFPTSLEPGERYGSVEPVMIDADIVGWASHQRLNPTQARSLRKAADDLERSLPSFPKDALPYFERLLRIARLALRP